MTKQENTAFLRGNCSCQVVFRWPSTIGKLTLSLRVDNPFCQRERERERERERREREREREKERERERKERERERERETQRTQDRALAAGA